MPRATTQVRNVLYARLLVTAGLGLVLVSCEPAALATSSPAGPSASPAHPSFTRPTPTPLPTFLIYTVAPGDTLVALGQRFGTSGRSIAYWNRDRYPSLDPDSPSYSPNAIHVGWVLRILPNDEVDPENLPPAASAS
ncbi:MAG: LysM peptidoglycan-binding domain-containing protein [Chloroflexota bacterium]